jgi:hypothetical protein
VALGTLLVSLTIEVAAAAPRYGRGYRWRPGSVANGAPGNSATRAAAAQQRALFLRQFDADGNGQLDAAEIVAARQAVTAMQQAQRAVPNGNPAARGAAAQQPNPDPAPPNEKNAAAGQQPKDKGQRPPLETFIDLFDKDGDGTLNAQELAAARHALAKRQERK